ncbi:MAG TPA: pseudouridine-5'-phosphate glycosidase [Candidatus Sulfopaludibacter sp.]|jgi:pseudouridine-5'-phosphate glycosidase|nr:pseudouridine-5'-phosphate glycosidase [Candidatus Sulfopaludibacter sp.]
MLALKIADEVRDSLAAHAPVVALETTIVTHGMPYPENVETARSLEREIRAHGAVPATIAVMDGEILVGLSDDELERLATTPHVLKLSRNDLAFAIATRQMGATTVAATMICAHLAGIRVFATGGIGGVHRGAESTFDISADLEELSRTPVAVVCAGAKALLDLPKTLEYLETRGVPVIGYRTTQFPAFWSRSSGLPVPIAMDSVDAIARMLEVKRSLGLAGGAVIANPVDEADEIPAREMAGYIDAAVADAAARAISGKAVTPYILARIVELTAGRSLRTNIALVQSNARLAAQLAAKIETGLPKEAGLK